MYLFKEIAEWHLKIRGQLGIMMISYQFVDSHYIYKTVYWLCYLYIHIPKKKKNIAFILKKARHGNVCNKYMFIDVWIWLVLWSEPQPSISCVIIKISNNLDRSLKFYDTPSLYPGLWIHLTSHYHSAGRHESVLMISKGWLHQESALGRNKVVEMKRFQRHENIPLIRVFTNEFYNIFIVNWCKIYAF